jgi:hypothetical protein
MLTSVTVQSLACLSLDGSKSSGPEPCLAADRAPHAARRGVFAETADRSARRDSGPVLSTDSERRLLRRWVRSPTLVARVVLRNRIIVMLTAVGCAVGTTPATVGPWRRRFLTHGPRGLLQDAPGRGRKPALSEEARRSL